MRWRINTDNGPLFLRHSVSHLYVCFIRFYVFFYQELKSEPDLLVEIIRLSTSPPPTRNSPFASIGGIRRREQHQEQLQQHLNVMDQAYNAHMHGPFGAGADYGAR